MPGGFGSGSVQGERVVIITRVCECRLPLSRCPDVAYQNITNMAAIDTHTDAHTHPHKHTHTYADSKSRELCAYSLFAYLCAEREKYFRIRRRLSKQ